MVVRCFLASATADVESDSGNAFSDSRCTRRVQEPQPSLRRKYVRRARAAPLQTVSAPLTPQEHAERHMYLAMVPGAAQALAAEEVCRAQAAALRESKKPRWQQYPRNSVPRVGERERDNSSALNATWSGTGDPMSTGQAAAPIARSMPIHEQNARSHSSDNADGARGVSLVGNLVN
eukprot:2523693-Rhodomonas_salina.2